MTIETLLGRITRRTSLIFIVFLLIELLDELVFGLNEAAWPLIQRDLSLTYTQIGLLTTIPTLVAALVEPWFGLWADLGHRRRLLIGGGVAFTLALAGIAAAPSFIALLLAITLIFPASGAFVSLAQTALMDADPAHHELNMARWALAGSVGVVAGPLVLSVVLWAGGGWRVAMLLMAALATLVTALAWAVRAKITSPKRQTAADDPTPTLAATLREAWGYLKRWRVLRWLMLLEFSDFMLDVLLSFLALYMVNEVGRTPTEAALAITVWSVVGLVGDLLLIPLLKRVDGLVYLRVSVVFQLALYPAFLLVPGFGPKLIVLGLLGLSNAGWYAILQGRLYSELPGRASLIFTIGTAGVVLGALPPVIIGATAEAFGLQAAMWILWLGPLVLWVGVPRRGS